MWSERCKIWTGFDKVWKFGCKTIGFSEVVLTTTLTPQAHLLIFVSFPHLPAHIDLHFSPSNPLLVQHIHRGSSHCTVWLPNQFLHSKVEGSVQGLRALCNVITWVVMGLKPFNLSCPFCQHCLIWWCHVVVEKTVVIVIPFINTFAFIFFSRYNIVSGSC